MNVLIIWQTLHAIDRFLLKETPKIFPLCKYNVTFAVSGILQDPFYKGVRLNFVCVSIRWFVMSFGVGVSFFFGVASSNGGVVYYMLNYSIAVLWPINIALWGEEVC